MVSLPSGWITKTPAKVRTPDGKEVIGTQIVATVDAVSDGKNNTIPVPKGFYYVGGTIESGVVISDDKRDQNKYASQTKAPGGAVPAGAIYNADGTVKEENQITEEEKDKVIYGNQFVWIPCTEANYQKQDFGLTDTKQWDISTNRAEIVQIQKYGGFYCRQV